MVREIGMGRGGNRNRNRNRGGGTSTDTGTAPFVTPKVESGEKGKVEEEKKEEET